VPGCQSLAESRVILRPKLGQVLRNGIIGMWPEASVGQKATFREGDFSGSIRVSPEGTLEFANHLLGTSVRLQVEHKQLIGNGHLIGSSLR
jgi:hypothetical protein